MWPFARPRLSSPPSNKSGKITRRARTAVTVPGRAIWPTLGHCHGRAPKGSVTAEAHVARVRLVARVPSTPNPNPRPSLAPPRLSRDLLPARSRRRGGNPTASVRTPLVAPTPRDRTRRAQPESPAPLPLLHQVLLGSQTSRAEHTRELAALDTGTAAERRAEANARERWARQRDSTPRRFGPPRVDGSLTPSTGSGTQPWGSGSWPSPPR